MAYKITKMKRINFEYFLWRTEVTLKQTKQFNHIYTYKSLIPLCLVVQVFTVFEISFGQGFLSRDRKQKNGYEFGKYEKHLDVLSFSVIPENICKIYAAISEKVCRQKKGDTRNTKERKKPTTITLRSSVENGSS